MMNFSSQSGDFTESRKHHLTFKDRMAPNSTSANGSYGASSDTAYESYGAAFDMAAEWYGAAFGKTDTSRKPAGHEPYHSNHHGSPCPRRASGGWTSPQRLNRMEQRMRQRMNRMEQRLERQIRQESQRAMNRSIRTIKEALVPVVRLEDGQVPKDFPATMEDFSRATVPQLNAWLRFYNLAQPRPIAEKKRILRQYLGLYKNI